MKKTLGALVVFLFVFFVVYLLGAFVQLGLDISTWTPDARSVVAWLGGTGGAVAAVASLAVFLDGE